MNNQFLSNITAAGDQETVMHEDPVEPLGRKQRTAQASELVETERGGRELDETHRRAANQWVLPFTLDGAQRRGKTNTTVTGGADEVAGSKTLSALSSVNSEWMLSTVSQIEDERRIRPAADNAASADGSFPQTGGQGQTFKMNTLQQ